MTGLDDRLLKADRGTKEQLAVVVGRNCKKLRTELGLTQDALANYARHAGLRWTASKVGDFEAGRRAPSFINVLLLTIALQDALRHANRENRPNMPAKIELADLVAGDGFVLISDKVAVPVSVLADVCRRGEGHQIFLLGLQDEEQQKRTSANRFVAEDRVAKRLGITPEQLLVLSLWLWGCRFTDERDSTAMEEADRGHFVPSAQYLAAITRRLEAELRRALAGEDMGERPWRKGRRRWHGNDQ
ncbi:helix-turn-helix domain-containing protein [Mycolicibacterium llatzerense]|uniref:helix-turn-helix domain-containing protein n=1 Tax=Mycolicibacterium llatzerense TaxID=280871 RepID=UPI0013A6A904|nr:helix-turn-helix transcriptional regulator [Mycolicibacterium llatzerense]